MADADRVTPGDRELRLLLGEARTVAVVGLSSKPRRPSFGVAEYLQQHGYRIVPVNPRETEVLGERAYPTLLELPTTSRSTWWMCSAGRRRRRRWPVRRSRSAPRSCGSRKGIVNEEAARIAAQGGLDVIMGVCIRTTRQRVMGEA